MGAHPAADAAGIAGIRVGKQGKKIALRGETVSGNGDAAPVAKMGAQAAPFAVTFFYGYLAAGHVFDLRKE
tara:strand:- start:190 stop:402 length:213 start_codon:yes stop_codon:yes gene_type:complete